MERPPSVFFSRFSIFFLIFFQHKHNPHIFEFIQLCAKFHNFLMKISRGGRGGGKGGGRGVKNGGRCLVAEEGGRVAGASARYSGRSESGIHVIVLTKKGNMKSVVNA